MDTAASSLSGSTKDQPSPSGRRRHTLRLTAQCAVAAACLALASAATAPTASSQVSTPNYLTTVNAYDSMSRTVAHGFGTADQGGSYLTSPASKFSVARKAGHITALAPGHHARATLSGVRAANEKVQSTFSLPTLPTQGIGVYYELELRRQTSGAAYRAQVRVATGGRLVLGFSKIRNGRRTPVGHRIVVPQRTTAGRTIVLQGLVTGSRTVQLRARAWLAGTGTPGWQLGATDSAANRLTAAGKIGLYAYTSATSRAARVTVAGLKAWSLTSPGSPPPSLPQRAAGKPGPRNTGVPAGTRLKRHNGNLVITKPGTTYDALDIHGFVTIRAHNVTIKRSIIRGGVATRGNVGLVTDVDARGTNFVLKDSELVPEHPSVYIDGIKGWNYTLLRDNIHGTVDAAKVFGNNTTIEHSWLHDTVYYLHDPNQGGGHTHNDGVQVLSGTHIRIAGNTITHSYNSALQVTQGHGRVSNLSFAGNWTDGGGCSVNINNGPLGSMSGISVTGNRFGHATRVANCPIVATQASRLSAGRNVFDDTDLAVHIRYG